MYAKAYKFHLEIKDKFKDKEFTDKFESYITLDILEKAKKNESEKKTKNEDTLFDYKLKELKKIVSKLQNDKEVSDQDIFKLLGDNIISPKDYIVDAKKKLEEYYSEKNSENNNSKYGTQNKKSIKKQRPSRKQTKNKRKSKKKSKRKSVSL